MRYIIAIILGTVSGLIWKMGYEYSIIAFLVTFLVVSEIKEIK